MCTDPKGMASGMSAQISRLKRLRSSVSSSQRGKTRLKKKGISESRMAVRISSAVISSLMGKPGVNFAETDQRQILVRVPANDLPGLFDGIARIPGAGEQVALVSGPAVVRGLGNARRALLPTEESVRLGQTADVGARGREKGPADAYERSEAEELGTLRGGLYDELRKIVDLPPQQEETATVASDEHPVHGPAPTTPEAGRKPGPRTGKIASKGPETPRPANAESLPPQGPATVAGADRMGEATAEPVEEVPDTTPGSGVARARGDAIASREPAGGAAIAEPSSLVDRRLEALDESRRAGGSKAKSEPPRDLGPTYAEASRPSEPPSSVYWTPDKPAEQYVTLVVQLMVPKPDVKKPPGRPGQPAAKAGETPTATPVNR